VEFSLQSCRYVLWLHILALGPMINERTSWWFIHLIQILPWQINDRYEFPLQLDLDREDGKYLSPDADRSVRNLYTLHRSAKLPCSLTEQNCFCIRASDCKTCSHSLYGECYKTSSLQLGICLTRFMWCLFCLLQCACS